MLVSIDSVCNISQIINPKKLQCSICFCINTQKSKQCRNNKCLKIYCDNCYFKNKMKNLPCPYCRISYDYIKCENEVYSALESLIFFCSISQCTDTYTFDKFITDHDHKKDDMVIIKCKICQKDISNSPNHSTCYNCSNKICCLNIVYKPLGSVGVSLENKGCCKRCGKCSRTMCSKCSRQKYQIALCEECDEKCSCGNKAETLCSKCRKSLCEKCVHIGNNNATLCNDCFTNMKSVLKCSICDKNNSDTKCLSCERSVCSSSCVTKCKNRKCSLIKKNTGVICIKCSRYCLVCKKIICKKCSEECSFCAPNISFVACKDCSTNIIRKCSDPACDKKLCINCWNVCNYCNTLHCKDHTLICLGCEENMCQKHFHICNICAKTSDAQYKKLCLKNCTNKCDFCPNINNALCDPNNHKNCFVSKNSCGHNVCESCVKKCKKCGKVVISCPQCIVNYYFEHCRFCGDYMCFDCAPQCSKCEDYYCPNNHQCCLCKKMDSVKCSRCEFMKRVKCGQCRAGLKQCEKCYKKYICSSDCYLNYIRSTNKDHICQMFWCEAHVPKYSKNKKQTPIQVPHNKIPSLLDSQSFESFQSNQGNHFINKNNVRGKTTIKSEGGITVTCSSCIIF